MDNAAMQLSTRLATIDDCAALGSFAARMFTENFGHLYTPKDLAAHLDKTCSPDFFAGSVKKDSIFITLDGTKIVGYIKAGKLGVPAEDPADDAMEIHRLYIDANYHRLKIGHTLMELAMNVTALKKASEIYIGVWEHNHNAQKFYANYGFKEVGEYLYWVGNHADRELILRRQMHEAG